MFGKQEMVSIKATKQIRNTIIAQDLDTLKEVIEDNEYDVNSFVDNEKTIFYFATLKNSPKDLFLFLLNNTTFETKKNSLLQLIENFKEEFTSYIILLLQNLCQLPKNELDEKIPTKVGSALLNALVMENKDESADKFIAWLLDRIHLDKSALELAIKAKRYDVLNMVLAAIYKSGGKQALPSLDEHLSEAIKNNEAECARILLVYGATPTIDDVEAVTSLKTFVALAQFGHVAGRYLKLDESIDTLNTELKNACLVGTYNNSKLITSQEISTILNTNDLVESDNQLTDSAQNVFARVLTDWSYWFKTLVNPLEAYEQIQSENTDAFDRALNIFKTRNENRLRNLIPFLTEKLANNRNATLMTVINNYKRRLIPSLKDIAFDAVINLINSSDDTVAKTILEKLPHSYLELLHASNRLKYQLEIPKNEEDANQDDLPAVAANNPINKVILLAFIMQLDDILSNIKINIGVKSAALSETRVVSLPQLGKMALFSSLISIPTNIICLATPDLRAIYNPQNPEFPLGVFVLLPLGTGILFFLAYSSLIILNLMAQDTNKLFIKKDMALYLAAIADYYQPTSPNETAALAELAVQLCNNPGNFRTTRILKEAKVILDKLNVGVTEDLPLNYKPVTVYPNSQNIVRLGDFSKHLTLFPLAQEKIKQVKASERTPLLLSANV